MQTILFIAEGREAAATAESALMSERAVIARTSSATEALMLLNEEPFDVIVCAIDEVNDAARDCLTAIKNEETPTVIVTRSVDDPVQSFDINMRVVAIDEGIAAVSTALRQQLRRARPRPQSANKAGGFDFEFKFRADPCRIGRARAIAGGFVQRCMEIDEKELTRFELALEEALVNAVIHGSLELNPALRFSNPDAYQQQLVDRLSDPGYQRRQVFVQLAFHDETLTVSVTDEGPGFEAESILRSSDANSNSAAFGRGFKTMLAFADKIEFNDVGNSITLTRSVAVSKPQSIEALMEMPQPECVAIRAVRVDNESLAGRT